MSDDRIPPSSDAPVSGDGPDSVEPAAKSRASKPAPARAIQSDEQFVDGSSVKPRHGIRKRTGLRVTLIVVIAIVLIVAGGVAYAWFDLNGRLNHQDVGSILGSDRPSTFTPTTAPSVKYPGDPYAGQAVNILVMGTDSREGANAGVSADDPGGMRSDTTFIAHVSADRTRVNAVSIPRDMYITIPQCTDQNGKIIPEAGSRNEGFNAAFSYGSKAGGGSFATGAACTIRAVEEMSNVRIDAYVVVDFMGFIDVVDSIGGLDVQLLCPIYAKAAGGLDLPAGEVHLDGSTAIQLARARLGTGLGGQSDLERVQRQHLLFNAIVDKVYAMNYVTDFPKLYSLVASVIGALTTDLGTNIAEIAGFGFSLKNLNTSNIVFVTVPVSDAGDHSHVVLRTSAAEPIWEALRTDQYLPGYEPVEPVPPDVNVDNPESETTGAQAEPQNPATSEEPPPPPGAPVVQLPTDC